MARRVAAAGVLAIAWALVAGAAQAADDPWPDQVVTIEQMKLLTPLTGKVFTKHSVDRKQTSTAVLHVHVGADGHVVRTRIERTSGNPQVDEGLMHALRTARFEPARFGGVAEPVTLVLPLTVPFRERTR